MKFGIIGAMPEETKVLIETLNNQSQTSYMGREFTIGRIENHEVVLSESGIGKVNSAIAATLLISHFDVDLIINTGSAGALASGLDIGDIVVCQKAAYHDADAQAFGYLYGQIPGMPHYYEADAKAVANVMTVLQQQGKSYQTGLIVSGDSFIASQDQQEWIVDHFPEALCTEMEGASIAQTAYQFQKPFLIIRSISDRADHEASVSFDEFIIKAGQESAAIVLETIKRYGES